MFPYPPPLSKVDPLLFSSSLLALLSPVRSKAASSTLLGLLALMSPIHTSDGHYFYSIGILLLATFLGTGDRELLLRGMSASSWGSLKDNADSDH